MDTNVSQLKFKPQKLKPFKFNHQKYDDHVYESRLLRLHPIGRMLEQIRTATEHLPKAMLFELKDMGYASLFEQTIACIISVRTFDEVSLPAALRLFKRANNAYDLDRLSEDEIYELIRPTSFGRQKAKSLKEIARITLERFDGELPADYDALTELPGLGPSSANLVLGIFGDMPSLGVDIHAHRITNRWGYLKTMNAEESLLELARRLPKKYWTEMNELLVPFGKNICEGKRPKCSICPVAQFCERNGVRNSQ